MKAMKQSGIQWIGDIPVNWCIKKIKYLANDEANSFIDGDWIESENISSEGIMYLTTGNIGDGVFKIQGDGFITEETFKGLKCKYAYPGDLVFSRLNAPYGRSCILGDIRTEYVLAVDNVILRTNHDKRYICYVSQCDGYQHSVEDDASGTTMKRISRTKLGNIYIPLPPVEEQIKISNYLDKKCNLIDKTLFDLSNQIELLQQYKKSVISEAVFGGLDSNIKTKESGAEWIKSIPEHWGIGRIASVYSVRNTKVNDRDYPPLSVTMQGIVPQLETAAKTDAHDDRKLVCKGDFAINSRSDRRGSCGISPCDGSISLINTVLCPLRNMNPGYYNWLFHTIEFADEFYKCGHGIVDDLWTTGWQEMKNILIPLPPLKEQELISKHLEDKCSKIDSVLSQKQLQYETLLDFKKSLIYEFVTGKKEIPNE